MRKNKISNTIQYIDSKYIEEAGTFIKEVHKPSWMRWSVVPVCACLIIAIMFIIPGIFSNKNKIVSLNNGSEITFVKSNMVVNQNDIACQIRELNNDEIMNIFGNLPITGYGLFSEDNNTILGIEGKYNNMKLIISKLGTNIIDTIIDGKDHTSNINGILVNAYYFDSNKTVIYYASFNLGKSTVYIENAGLKREEETVKKEIAFAIEKLIELEHIDLSKIIK